MYAILCITSWKIANIFFLRKRTNILLIKTTRNTRFRRNLFEPVTDEATTFNNMDFQQIVATCYGYGATAVALRGVLFPRSVRVWLRYSLVICYSIEYMFFYGNWYFCFQWDIIGFCAWWGEFDYGGTPV